MKNASLIVFLLAVACRNLAWVAALIALAVVLEFKFGEWRKPEPTQVFPLARLSCGHLASRREAFRSGNEKFCGVCQRWEHVR